MLLKGKKAIVTGGSRGIGAACVLKLAAEGVDIAVIYAGSKEKAESICQEASGYGVASRAYRCDVSDFQTVKETVKQIKADFGTVDILVNNAGITRDTLLSLMKESDFDEVIDTNLKGTFHLIRQVLSIMIRNRSGVIINISSVVGMHGNVGQANYAASKAGVIGLTKSAAKELAPRGIRCNAVAPGFIDTDMTRNLNGHRDEWIRQIPLGRAGKPEEIAEAVVYLAGADYITGHVLVVDGGMSM